MNLYWIRNDLRVSDNKALSAACESGEGVLAVFFITREQWQEHDDAAIKIAFWQRNLIAMKAELEKLNVPLQVVDCKRFDAIPEQLKKLCDHHNIRNLFYNKQYEWNERQCENAIAEKFAHTDLSVHSFHDQVLFKPGDIATQDGSYYKVFTPFKNNLRSKLAQIDFATAPRPKKQPDSKQQSDSIPDFVKGQDAEQSAFRPDLWKAGEKAASQRLQAFVAERIRNYKNTRDLPAVNGTSTISPYLAAGVVSVRQCFTAVHNESGGKLFDQSGMETWLDELIWREFYKHILVGYPRVSRHQPFRLETNKIDWEPADEKFTAWCEGKTGFPIVDAAMRQLNQTGWMHNRLRMIVAMFLTKDLLIDWRCGEQYFMSKLVDGDLAANNGGWQWSASTGTDAAPYFRIFNPESQSKKYDPKGEFIRRFVPELNEQTDKLVHQPYQKSNENPPDDYPQPIIDHSWARKRAIEVFKTALG